MSWPTQGDYNQALQNPGIALRQPELRAGRCHANKSGIPVPWSGQNAAVYRLHANDRVWALKCFTREVQDQASRYRAISEHLKARKVPYTTAFEFHPEGINVKGHWYPLLQMEWVEGERLNEFVARHIDDRRLLRLLARQLLEMVRDLQAADIAHGDLQHGNILVSGDHLRLVDYDGMWVPALSRLTPSELGHPHYQHPSRLNGLSKQFGRELDNFSCWVMVFGLYALAVDRSLWEASGCGEDWLLFRDEDFRANGSGLLARLERHPDRNLRLWALNFRVLIYSQPETVPLPNLPIETEGLEQPPASTVSTPWYRLRPSRVEPAPRQEPPSPGSTWIVTHRPPPLQARFRQPPGPARRVLGASTLAGCSVLWSVWALGNAHQLLLILALAALDLAYLLSRHGNEPDVRRLFEARTVARDVQQRLKVRRQVLKSVLKDKDRQLANAEQEAAALRAEEEALRAGEDAECRALEEAKALRLSDLTERIAQLNVEEAKAKTVLRNGSRLPALESGLRSAKTNLDAVLQAALQQLRQQHVASYLQGSLIERADLRGIGTALKARLASAGLRTAADIHPAFGTIRKVEGIGPAKSTVLASWRREREQAALQYMPQHLPSATEQSIRSQHGVAIKRLEAELLQEQARVAFEIRKTEEAYAHERLTVERMAAAIVPETIAETAAVQAKYAESRRQLAERTRAKHVALANGLQESDGRVVRARKEVADAELKSAIKRKELEAVSAVSFGRYVRYVLLGGQP